MEFTHEEEELLSLGLAIAADHGCERLKKRKRREALNGGLEGEVFTLLQVREQMVKADQYKTTRKGVAADGKGLHLIHLLLISATSVDANDVSSALHSLTELYRSVSLTGDSVQRVAAHFADALFARLLTPSSPFFDTLMKRPTPEEEFLAFTHLYRASVYFQFAHFTANQAILEAFEEEHRDQDGNNNTMALHVIDLELSYGFQWPSLMQSLSEKASSASPISLRITGFGTSLAQLQETETQLVSFAKGFRNLVFEFQGLPRGSNIVDIRKRKNETVAVNLAFYLTSLSSLADSSETLHFVRSLAPSIVVLVEQEGSRSPRSFLSRFMECLHHFAAMFDSLDDCLPLDSVERLSIEKNHLGKEIKSAMTMRNCREQGTIKADEAIGCSKYERMETWKGRMEGHGFAGLKLSSKSTMQAKLLLKIRSHCCPIQADHGGSSGFRVFERDEGRALSLGWQDRYLITASAWNCG